MKSTDRILTTHVGSLPRPQEVVDILFAQDRGEAIDEQKFDATIRSAVADAVNKQAQAGLDIVSDGEMGKISYATYIRHRLTGFEPGNVPRATPQDQDDFPAFRDKIAAAGATPKYIRPICKGPIKVKTLEPLKAGYRSLQGCLVEGQSHRRLYECGFAWHHSGIPAERILSEHEAYLEALAEAMRTEYETIVNSGLIFPWIARIWPWAGTSSFAAWTTTNSCAMRRCRWRR